MEAEEDPSKQVPPLVKLGELYLKKAKKTKNGADFTKADALYNAALVRSRKENHEIGEDEILRRIVETYREFLRAFANGEEVRLNEIRDEIRGNKDWIKHERQVFKDRLDKMDSYLEDKTTTEENDMILAEKMEEVFRDIQDMYVRLVSKLVKECESRLGKPPCDYAIIALGSIARMEATPFSDLEFTILYSDPAIGDKINYFRVLTHFLHLKVINLGETILPALGIEELEDFQSSDSWFKDNETPRGISFDGAMPWASKTPLGRMATKNKPALELIRTPEEMAELQDEEIAMKEGYHLADIMSRASLLYGDKSLLDEYNKRVEGKLNAKSSGRLYLDSISRNKVQDYCWENTVKEGGIISRPVLLVGDEARKLNAKPSVTGKSTKSVGFMRGFKQMLIDIRNYDPNNLYLGLRCAVGGLFDVEKQFFRLISLLVSDLGMIFDIRDPSPWQVISQLLTRGIIGESESASIKVCLSIASEMRLKTYFANNGQKEQFSSLPQYANTTKQSADAPIFHDFVEDVLVRLLSTSNDMHKRCREFCKKYLEEDEIGINIYQNPFVASSKPTLLGSFYFRLGNLRKALEWMKKESKDSPDYGASLNGQGVIYFLQGEYHKSVQCFENAREHSQNSIRGLLMILNNHALALMGIEQYETAENKIKEAIVKHNEIYGEGSNTIELCMLKRNLGRTFYEQGHTILAIETFREVEQMAEKSRNLSKQMEERSREISGQIRERILPDIDVLQLKILFAKSFSKLDEYAQSLDYIEQAEELIRKLFGKHDLSPLLASFYREVGEVYESCHKSDKAVLWYEESLKMLQHLFGYNPHRETIHCLCSLGRILCDRNQTSEAVEHLESALKQARILYGEKPHLDIAEILNILGKALSRAGKLDKSLSLFREAEKMMDQILGPNHAHSCTASIYDNMGTIYKEDFGDLDKAMEYHTKAVDMKRKNLNSRNTSHLGLVLSLYNLGCTCIDRGEQDEALKHWEEAREIAKGAGIKHYVMLQVVIRLRDLYYDMKCDTKSKMCCQEAIEIAKSLPEDDTYPPSILEELKLLKEVTEIAEDAGYEDVDITHVRKVLSDQKASSLQVRDMAQSDDALRNEMAGGSNIACKFSLARLKEDCGFCADELETFSQQSWSYEDKQQLLNKLAELMLDHNEGLCIAKHFRGILLEILKRTQDLVQRNIEAKKLNHLKFSVTLSYFLPQFPYILSFVLTYFQENGPFFDEGMNPDEYSLVIETAYRFLSFSPTTFRGLWNWGVLCEVNVEKLESEETKWLFTKTMSIVFLNGSSKGNSELRAKIYDNSSISQTKQRNNVESTNTVGELQTDMQSLQDKTNEKSSETANQNEKGNSEALDEIVFTENDLLGEHMIMANMLIPKISKTSLSSQELVVVPSMRKNVEALSVAFVSGKAILISGAVGSGKTSLVEHFSSLVGRDKPPYLFKVQLGDQTDSEALIGSYCCSDVPGQFVWRPGILTRAVREGRWLLLEDIDCAPMDVISVLIPLLELRVLSIPGKETIQAAPDFQLFATQRVGRISRGFNSESSMIEHLWSKVTIEPLTKNELEEIVVTKFPNLQPLAKKLVETFSLLSSDLQLNSKPDTRNVSLSADKRLATVRDFMKWCRRLKALSNTGPTLLNSQDIFQEAMDCFCANISNLEYRMSMALAIGTKLNLDKVKVEFVCNLHKPAIKVAPLCFTVGRITLNREQVGEQIEKPNFAFTRHSLTLLESLAVCVSQTEPVLLIGETGTGKTSAIQYLASLCNRALVVVNMSQQSDSTDLIGGFKPMEMKQLVAPVREEFETLFRQTFSMKQNVKFLINVQQCFGQRNWEVLFKVMMHSQQAALERLSSDTSTSDKDLLSLWKNVGQRIQHFRQQLKHGESDQMFSFVEGALVKAIKQGDWVLLDEINLATAETLECLNGVLESQQGSVVVLERGDAEPIFRHEQFRMFACMNPANDVGKKDLPAGIRNRFTEIFVSELQEVPELKTLVFSYLQGLSPPGSLIDGIVSFYLVIREETGQKLTDGSGNRPYYSLRTLCRALKYASRNPHGNILRSVYEGFCISFLTQLDRSSRNIVEILLQEKLLGHVNARSLVNQPLRKPDLKDEKLLNFEGYWICEGNLEPTRSPNYVFTSTVKDNLKCLARIVSGRDFPVLIQGETSVGKTSLINWLAKASGNYCVRINNHEHTDIQEYLGCYTSDASGKLVFKEGILVDAMRKGYWIILDELNLAPSDVLEALNRLLDDNRELFIPEIQETVKAHPKFMLFATQNPPGHYGGRKVLSRAFRNRFVELHFEELPSKELKTILHKRCNLPVSYSRTLVNIMLELQVRRRGSTVFSGKQGFITLRDLFRWADRYSKSQASKGTFFDWNQQLAEDGYFLLAGRCRNAQETLVVQDVIEKNTKRKINVECLFGHPSTTKLSSFSEKILSELINNCPQEFGHVVFTYNMRRLAVLVARALQFNEPVLLVGETGCGKTTICQVFAAVQKKKLYAVNCHLHTETSDFLGGLHPARREENAEKDTPMRPFEWCDGSLVKAMKGGGMFLADEISLADDSVLERLNSVLEPERTLVLAEKGSSSDSEFQQDIDLIIAEHGFQLLATMNPGGDYGKKELSPALRNRFTEIWCPANDNPADVIAIIEHNVLPGITLKLQPDGSSGVGNAIIEFIKWFKLNNFAKRCIVTVRDFLSWVQFINVCSSTNNADQHTLLEPSQAYYDGAFLVFLDALGLGAMVNSQSTSSARELCSQFLLNQLKDVPKVVNGFDGHDNATIEAMETEDNNNEIFTFGRFSIPRGPELSPNIQNQYALNARTTVENAKRVMRAMQLHRPILLEGSPGVGKTSLVSALAKASGHRLVRINLSEQTDISDLFGADLPVEGGQGCQFSWCDGPLLLALKSGSWILLDELNLTSQSVLEGLNACFDHRGEIFIPELGMSFQVQHERTKFFACQNPLNQGGGRKGLPKSFLNRFSQVYVEPLTHDDLLFITQSMYPTIDSNTLVKMITFNAKVHKHCVVEGLCSKHGGSWEFNLRDIFRWCELMIEYQNKSNWNPVAFVQLVYVGRMRTDICRNKVWELGSLVFGENSAKDVATLVYVTPTYLQVGQCLFPNCDSHMQDGTFQTDSLYMLHRTLKPLESLLTCLKMNWLAILVGPRSSCKTSLVRLAARLTGTKYEVMAMNSSIDTTELLGGYEQADLERKLTDIKEKVKEEIFRLCRSLLDSKKYDDIPNILKQWFAFCDGNDVNSMRNNKGDLMDELHVSALLDNISQLSKLIHEAIDVCQRHNFTGYNFDQLKDRVTELHEHLIQNNGNSHVSGQFEWVDGQLVKALESGHWLLIDNVNFCSPSVLDRLNGLLEPGGVLNINERGVVGGKIPVVKPHPEFRLIFAMDPKYGEISRAMRNRGVEIFMMQEDCDTDDLCNMLYASGCRNPTAVQTLLNFHDHNEKGSLLQTIHAGSLMSELWKRGIEPEKSLDMSLNHVYNESYDSTQVNPSMSCQFTTEEQSALEPSKLASHAAMITWHAVPLERIIKDDSKSSTNVAINIFLEWCSKEDWLIRLQWLSRRMECYRYTFELEITKDCLGRLFESKAVKRLYDFYGEMKCGDFKFDLSHQPVNIRVNGPLYKYICCKLYSDQEVCKLKSCTNRVYLLWTLLALEAEEESHLKSVDESQLKTPLWLSFAYSKGQVTLESLPHRGIAHIYPLLQSFRECTHYLLESSEQFIDDNVAYKIWVSLKQYKRFFDVCTQCYSQDENYHALFDIRCKFFSNGALDTICEVLNDFHCEIAARQELVSVKKCLDEIFENDNEIAVCHWKKIIIDFEHPTVFVFEEICILWAKLTKLYAGLVHHNPEMKVQVEATVNQTRVWQVALLEDMVSLIELREGKIQQEKAENILVRIKESVNRIEQERCCDEIMDQSSSDVLAQFSEISIHNKGDEHSENLNEVYGSEIIQGYCSVVANCAYAECINFLKLISLRKKILNETNLPNSEVKWNQRWMGYCNFCVKYLREIPLNTAVIQYILQSGQDEHGFPKCYSSVLKLADDNVFCNLTEKKYQERIVESKVTCPLPNNRCSVKTFQALSVIPAQQYSTTDKNQGQIRLVDVNEKIVEYNHLNTFLWLHQNLFANLDSTQLSINRKSFMLAFIRLIHCLNSINEIPDCQSMYSDFLSFSKFEKQSLEKYIANIKGRYDCVDEDLEDSFRQILKYLGSIVNTDVARDSFKKIEGKAHRGMCWENLGRIQSELLEPVGNVDPVEEANVKVDSIKHEIVHLKCELKVRLQYEELLTGVDGRRRSQINQSITLSSIDEDSVPDSVSDTLQINPSHVKNLVKYQAKLTRDLSEIGDEVAYRPDPSQFRKIIGIVRHFYATVCLSDSRYPEDSNVVAFTMMVKSTRKCILQLQDFVAYQDVLGPYISGLIQFVQGLEMMISADESKLMWLEYKTRQSDVEACLPQEIVSCVLPFSCSYNSMSTRVGSLLSEEISRGIKYLCHNSCVPRNSSLKVKTNEFLVRFVCDYLANHAEAQHLVELEEYRRVLRFNDIDRISSIYCDFEKENDRLLNRSLETRKNIFDSIMKLLEKEGLLVNVDGRKGDKKSIVYAVKNNQLWHSLTRNYSLQRNPRVQNNVNFPRSDTEPSGESSSDIEVLCSSCPSILADCKECKERREKLKSRILMLALNMLTRSVCYTRYTTPNDIQHLKTVTNFYETLWLQREEERKVREEEGDSVYKFKTKTYCSDEESEEQQNQKEIDELFTTFDQEYKDIHFDKTQQASSMEKKQESSQSKASVETILESDMAQFCKIHQFLVSSAPNVSQVRATLDNTEWEQVDTRLEDVKIASECYNIASEIIKLADLFDDDLLDDTTPSHLVMSSLLFKSLSSCQSGSTIKDQADVCSANLFFGRRSEGYDIYHDSNLKEIIQVLPILTSFKSRLQQLLEEWPEHPTLVQLCQTSDRIMSFPVTSPVMKILNGLEILLRYSQEWESNASRHVSVRGNLDQITQMIIRWRKLELSCWSSLLHVCEVKTREKANHWWFHIHHVIQQYSVPKDGGSADFIGLIKVLQQFMERSSLGEFSERLKILASFSYQETIDNVQNDNSGIVRIILWNIYCYYKQFESRVGSLIQKAKAPIEKELKGFINIVKWKDINYWAMKETSTKSHYTLLKLMKKYQAALSEGIDGILSSIGQVVSFEEPAKQDDSCYKLEPNTFLSPINLQNPDLKDTDSEHERLRQIFSKMKKLTQQKLNVLRYEVLSASVNKFTDEIISTTHSLQKLEIGDKTGKERTQWCKHIHTLKKRALADLFKGLKKIGLSYRKGISLRQKNSLKDPMMVNCSNVLRTLRNMDILFKNNENSNFLPMLENSMEYYQKCITRSAVLNNVLTSPSKDLTMGDIDRMKGFAEHLRQITQRQRESISTVGKLLSKLSLVTRQLENLATSQPCRLPPQHDVADWTLKLDELLNRSLETSENLLSLLDTCPDSKIDLTMSPIPEQLSDLSKCCKQDTVYVCLKKGIEMFHDKISKIKSEIYSQTLMLYPASNTKEEEDNDFIATWFHLECLELSFKQLEGTLLYLDEFVKMETRPDLAKDTTSPSDLGFGKLAFHLRQKIRKTCDKFTDWNKKTFEETQNDTSEEQFSSLRCNVTSTRESIRLSFQKWYKRRESEIDEAKESIVREEVEDDKYFVEGLDNELLADISILNIQERTKDIKSFIKLSRQAIDGQYKNYNITSIQRLCETMISILPCLSQYVLLIEYHFHQLLLCHRSSCKLHSVLLGIFSELLQKGFCLPPNEEGMESEGATSFEDAENCGIGEGEGRKDVSDQIENEEQLLGGEQQKSEEKEKGDKNQIADEEHGIEMSEDFEGETHDVEKSGKSSDEEGESGDESENLEQRMGDVDGADETLDEKLWADSDGENDNDDKDDADERGAEGEGQSEMVAKEENRGSSKEGKSKPKIDKMEEDKINELGKDEDDIGNLDDNFTDNKNEEKPDDLQPEDMKLPDDLEIDSQENDDAGDDAGDGVDDSACEDDDVGDNDKDEVGDANNSDDEVGDKRNPQMIEDQESIDETNKEDENDQNQDQADLEKDEEDDDNVKENKWKTESETKGENVESIEDQGNPDASSGISAGNERSEPTNNDESKRERDNEVTGNSISQQSGLDSTDNSTTHKTTDLPSNDTRSHRKQLNKSRADRSLGSSEETTYKKRKVLNSSEDGSNNSQPQDTSSAELFEHIRNETEMHDKQVYDAATAEQRQEEAVNYPTETEGQDETENMDEDWELPPGDNNRIADGKEENSERGLRLQSDKTQSSPEEETNDVEMSTEDQDEVRKEWQDTRSSVFMGNNPSSAGEDTEALDPEKCRSELEELLCKWRDLEEGSPEEQATALDTWHKYVQLTSTHSQQLCEQLRIVLEPSVANKLRGDYRTGKRLNMRKVIPYIASQYRKDKIWLRRTKKSKRQYQILLAIDDSSSMSDNKSKQLAFESLAVITNALTRLEAGEIAICSFGEEVQLLHPFHETFTEQSGANMLRQFRFEQKKTKIAQLLDSCTSVMVSARSRVNIGNDVSQLLLIVSDGRGIFLEGFETVQRAVRKAREAGIFLVFVILDNPTNKDSILDIKFPIFRPGQLPELKSYMEQFPFQFYIVLRDISSLPDTLSDSLRQWFELVTNMS